MSPYRIVPVTGRAALRWIAQEHRHLPKLQGALFAAGVAHGETLVGVATAGNPPREWLGTGRIIVSRVAVRAELPSVAEHAAPACTMLYGAICRAAAALGYREAWTYTLPGEDGRSIRAAGFSRQGDTRANARGYDCPSRPRPAPVCGEAKGRWMRPL